MVKSFYSLTFLLFFFHNLEAQFAPAAGLPGSTAVYKDSIIITQWAKACKFFRGPKQIGVDSLGFATVGDSTMAIGMADGQVVSLGDGGMAECIFDKPIKNGVGFDFAIFENSFLDTFLELAFVEVSSDGINFFRFPSISLTQDTQQINSFGAVNPEQINNLAGKYRLFYGTPFDLEELQGITGLDINHITHIRIIDVVGSIDNAFARFDSQGHKINEIFPTPFPSSGFDLDAIGVIHTQTSIFEETTAKKQCKILQNPIRNKIFFNCLHQGNIQVKMFDIRGNEVLQVQTLTSDELSVYLSNGYYFLQFIVNNQSEIHPLIIHH
jgi:hypothetical protein